MVETVGGFMISIQMDQHGSWALENFSSTSFGKRFAIFTQFDIDTDKKNELCALAGSAENFQPHQ